MLKTINLDQQAALDHVRDRLSLGNLLASRVSALPLESGSVSTLLPERVNPSKVSNSRTLREGGIAEPSESREIERAVAEFISGYLSRSERQLAIFEHSLANASDPWVAKCEIPLFVQGAKIFFYLTQSDAQPDRILLTMRAARTALAMMAVLTNLGTLETITDRQSVPSELIEVLAENTQHVIVDAYDGEGFLVWSR